MSLREILIRQGPERLETILATCPRKSREELYRRLGIKGRAPRAGFRLKSVADDRPALVHQKLSEAGLPDALLEELVRNFMFSRRGLLADALDFLEVQHRDGLTDEDLDFLAELDPEQGSALRADLDSKGHDMADVDLYFCLMTIPEKQAA